MDPVADASEARTPALNHQPEFAAHWVTLDADQALIVGALALARTAIAVATDPALSACLLAEPYHVHRMDTSQAGAERW